MMTERQGNFRKEYRSRVAGWYNGYLHVLVIYTIGSKAVPAAELALLAMTEVVLGPLWVWIFLDETASTNTLLGGAVIMAAIAGNALSGFRHKPTPIL